MNKVPVPVNPTMMFVEYKLHRTEDMKIQIDEALPLDKLNPTWSEGDTLKITIEDNRVTLTKL